MIINLIPLNIAPLWCLQKLSKVRHHTLWMLLFLILSSHMQIKHFLQQSPQVWNLDTIMRLSNILWRYAMKDEVDALDINKTWDIVTLPPGKVTIGCKWVYKIKYFVDGSIERYKARLVALGNKQNEGEDLMKLLRRLLKCQQYVISLVLWLPRRGKFIKWIFITFFFMVTLTKRCI